MQDDATIHQPDAHDRSASIASEIPMARPIHAEPHVGAPNPLLLTAEPRKSAWADIGIVLLLLISFEVSIGTLMGVVTGSAFSPGDEGVDRLNDLLVQEILIPMLSLRGLASCMVVYLIVRHRRQTRASVGLRSYLLPLDVALGLITPVVVYGVGVLTILLLSRYWSGTIESMEENAERLMEIIPPLPLWAYVPLAVLIGVYEELLFRGFLMPRVRRATGSWLLAVIVSTGLFTLLHAGDQTAPALIMVTILSLTFSVLTIWRCSIIPAVIAHTLWDLTMFVVLHFVVSGELS